MKKSGHILLLAAAGLLLVSCAEDPTRPASGPISGQVVDTDGQPVIGAAILLEYELPVFPADKLRTAIRFELPEADRVRVWVSDRCHREILRTLYDGEAPGGTHTYYWDGRDEDGLMVTSGRYRFNLQTGNETTGNDFLLIHGGYDRDADPATFRHHAVTDVDGRFTIAQGCLAFGYVSTAINESGQEVGTFTVSRTCKLFALHPDFPTGSSKWVTADMAEGVAVSITLTR